MSIESQMEREIEAIEQDSADGRISSIEAQRQIRDVMRDYQSATLEAEAERLNSGETTPATEPIEGES